MIEYPRYVLKVMISDELYNTMIGCTKMEAAHYLSDLILQVPLKKLTAILTRIED